MCVITLILLNEVHKIYCIFIRNKMIIYENQFSCAYHYTTLRGFVSTMNNHIYNSPDKQQLIILYNFVKSTICFQIAEVYYCYQFNRHFTFLKFKMYKNKQNSFFWKNITVIIQTTFKKSRD